jgi:hypothetical protein
MNDTSNLRDTIAPKSDQLNADDLIAGTITVRIVGVRRGSNDQPVIVDIDGGFQPYKPCLSMRRVMIAAWGDNGNAWVGKSMTLYCDPSVKFGKVAMGGIRISHMSHINEPFNIMLTTTRARRSNFKVEPLKASRPVITPSNAKMWERAKEVYRECGNLFSVKEKADISDELESQLINEVMMETEHVGIDYAEAMEE